MAFGFGQLPHAFGELGGGVVVLRHERANFVLRVPHQRLRCRKPVVGQLEFAHLFAQKFERPRYVARKQISRQEGQKANPNKEVEKYAPIAVHHGRKAVPLVEIRHHNITQNFVVGIAKGRIGGGYRGRGEKRRGLANEQVAVFGLQFGKERLPAKRCGGFAARLAQVVVGQEKMAVSVKEIDFGAQHPRQFGKKLRGLPHKSFVTGRGGKRMNKVGRWKFIGREFHKARFEGGEGRQTFFFQAVGLFVAVNVPNKEKRHHAQNGKGARNKAENGILQTLGVGLGAEQGAVAQAFHQQAAHKKHTEKKRKVVEPRREFESRRG